MGYEGQNMLYSTCIIYIRVAMSIKRSTSTERNLVCNPAIKQFTQLLTNARRPLGFFMNVFVSL